MGRNDDLREGRLEGKIKIKDEMMKVNCPILKKENYFVYIIQKNSLKKKNTEF